MNRRLILVAVFAAALISVSAIDTSIPRVLAPVPTGSSLLPTLIPGESPLAFYKRVLQSISDRVTSANSEASVLEANFQPPMTQDLKDSFSAIISTLAVCAADVQYVVYMYGNDKTVTWSQRSELRGIANGVRKAVKADLLGVNNFLKAHPVVTLKSGGVSSQPYIDQLNDQEKIFFNLEKQFGLIVAAATTNFTLDQRSQCLQILVSLATTGLNVRNIKNAVMTDPSQSKAQQKSYSEYADIILVQLYELFVRIVVFLKDHGMPETVIEKQSISYPDGTPQ